MRKNKKGIICKCGNFNNLHVNYDYSKKEIIDVICNECDEVFKVNKITINSFSIFNLILTLFLLILNSLGVLAWSLLYIYGIYKQWWVFILIGFCSIGGIAQLPYLYNYFKNKL